MNLIVTGNVESGKTTWCSRYADQLVSRGFGIGGVLSPAVTVNGSKIGCDVCDQQTRERAVFTRLFAHADFDGEPVGRYLISSEGLAFADQAIRKAVADQCDLIFIDEIGPLELAGSGLIDAARLAYREAPATVTVVRKKLLNSYFANLQYFIPVDQFTVCDIGSAIGFPPAALPGIGMPDCNSAEVKPNLIREGYVRCSKSSRNRKSAVEGFC